MRRDPYLYFSSAWKRYFLARSFDPGQAEEAQETYLILLDFSGSSQGLRKNNLAFWHLIFTPSSAAPQSRNPQRRPGYACGLRSIVRGQIWRKSERQFYQVILAQILGFRHREGRKPEKGLGRGAKGQWKSVERSSFASC